MSRADGRHRHSDQRDRPDSHPDRLGAHHPARPPFTGATIPAERLTQPRDPGDGRGSGQARTTAAIVASLAICALLCVCCGNWPW